MVLLTLGIAGLLYGLVSGWIHGLVKELCSTLGFALGILLAFYCYLHYDMGYVWPIVLALAFPVVLGFVATLLSTVLNHTPVLGTMNRLLGAVVGCLKMAAFVYFILLIIENIEEWKQWEHPFC